MLVNIYDLEPLVGLKRATTAIHVFTKVLEIEITYKQMTIPSKSRWGPCTQVVQIRHVDPHKIVEHYTKKIKDPRLAHNHHRYRKVMKVFQAYITMKEQE